MVEIIIERWIDANRSVTFRWSVWREGRRIGMGGPHPKAEPSEAEAERFCTLELGRKPDRVTRL
ncbi:MAG: hypothetical protein ACT4P2_10270 [Pseudomonadota bacterium]